MILERTFSTFETNRVCCGNWDKSEPVASSTSLEKKEKKKQKKKKKKKKESIGTK